MTPQKHPIRRPSSIETDVQPLAPLLTALQKKKLSVELRGESAKVRRRGDKARPIEAFDLFVKYTSGNAALNLVVYAIETLLAWDVGRPLAAPKREEFAGDDGRFQRAQLEHDVKTFLASSGMRRVLLKGGRVSQQTGDDGEITVNVTTSFRPGVSGSPCAPGPNGET
jgi:hypothetical protein